MEGSAQVKADSYHIGNKFFNSEEEDKKEFLLCYPQLQIQPTM